MNPSGEARTGEQLEVTRQAKRHQTSREQASLRRNAAFHVLRSSEGQGPRVRPGIQGQERRVAAERRCGPVRKGLEAVDEIFLGTRAEEDLTRFVGLPVPWIMHPSPRTRVLRAPSGAGGWRTQGVEGESFEGAETREKRPVAAGQP